MIHTSKRCPHCSFVYETDSHRFSHIGSPLLTCKRCGRQFFDKDYTEPYFEATPKKSTFWGILLGVALSPFGLATIALFLLSRTIDHISGLLLPAVPFVVCVSLVIYTLCKQGAFYEKQCAEHRASRERLMNRDYVILLLEHGCYVPTSFLLQYHPDLTHHNVKGSAVPKNKDCSYMT